MVNKIILFLFFLSSISYADCINHNYSKGKILKNIDIQVLEERKFFKSLSELYLSLQKEASIKGKWNTAIDRKKRVRFNSKVIFFYKNNGHCIFKSKIRFHGDYIDHIELINGIPIPSIRVKLEEGNFNGITRFKLLRPLSRLYDNEIFITTLLKELGFLSPRTFKVNVKFLNKKVEYLFQEFLKKEFLENNRRVEGPILESNEDFSNALTQQMTRVSNKEWIKSNNIKAGITINALKDHNMFFLKSYKMRNNKYYWDEIIRFNKKDFSQTEYENIGAFDALMYSTGSEHGLSYDDRRFYYDPILSSFEPIYYDGNSNVLSYINYWQGNYQKVFENHKKIKRPNLENFENYKNISKNLNKFPPISNIARVGSEIALSKIKKLDRKKLLENLHKNGMPYISEDQVNVVINNIIQKLIMISEGKIYNNYINFTQPIYSNFFKDMKLKNDLKLIFLSDFFNLENKSNTIEVCDFKILNCKILNINKKEFFKLVEQRSINDDYSIFLSMTKKDYLNDKLDRTNKLLDTFKKLEIEKNFTVYFNKEIDIEINKLQKF